MTTTSQKHGKTRDTGWLKDGRRSVAAAYRLSKIAGLGKARHTSALTVRRGDC